VTQDNGPQYPGFEGQAPPPYGQPPYAPPYGQPPYAPQPYGYGYPPPRRTNGLAIAGIVLGWVGVGLGLLGIVVGIAFQV
jgi:hypothetical protein